jgi:hypothetical protein
VERFAVALTCASILSTTACADGDGLEPPTPVSPSPERGGVLEPGLREELLAMQERDQAQRTGEPVGTETDIDRTVRLREIVDEYGWPTPELVGKDGASAAWLIAQHSDFDVAFQVEVLALMRDALDEGDADATEVAYLQDRVAVNTGRPQTYGTQIRCRGGRARPATPISDRPQVDELRAEIGLEPLEDYLASFEEACAAELGT